MNFEEIAKSLIDEVCGIQSDEHVKGVTKVFKSIMDGVNFQWEQHLAAETTEVLMYDEVICTCGNIIDVVRERRKYTVEHKQ